MTVAVAVAVTLVGDIMLPVLLIVSSSSRIGGSSGSSISSGSTSNVSSGSRRTIK